MKEFCVDLEIAKELKENGFLQDSKFYFMRQDFITFAKTAGLENRKPWALSIIVPKKDKEDFLEYFGHKDKWMGIQPEHFISAPISDEILKELRKYKSFIQINTLDFNILKIQVKTYPFDWITAKKLSNALAKMWLYLKKEGY